MHSKCIIIGGGLAGLSAAVYLAEAGIHVELFESSPKLGGRAYSFSEANTGDVIDNGQHIMMGCYFETLKFLKLIRAESKLSIQDTLKVNFVDKTIGLTPLKAVGTIYPFNLLLGLLSYKALSFSGRLEIIRLFAKLPFLKPESMEDLTVFQWLEKEKQSKRTIKAFWEILAIGALNTDISRASASIFIIILKKMFLKGSHAASIILPGTGLSELYCEDSAKFICTNGGSISLSEPVKSVEIHNNAVKKINLANREVTDFDFVISAVPFYSFSKLFSAEFVKSLNPDNASYSSILSLNLWLKENPFKEEFYGFIDSPVHWVFDHKKYITVVISNADEIIEKSKEDLKDIICSELEKYFPQFNRSCVYMTKLIKEKRATFIPDSIMLQNRPHTVSSVRNLFLAGDWIATGLPATIEGAVKSGHDAALAGLKFSGNL
ncbi:MAG: hydroxysqualene dehydroxylase HpnE [Syntrophomonadaceae bacterium]